MNYIEPVLSQKTLAIFYPGCIEFETMLTCEIINKDLPVEVATPGGDPGSVIGNQRLSEVLSVIFKCD